MPFWKVSKKLTESPPINPELEAISASHIMLRMDFDATVTDVNDAFCNHMGYAREAIIGKPYTTFVRSKDRKEFQSILADVKAGDNTTRIVPRLTQSGEEAWFAVTYTPVLNADGKGDHILAVSHDISEWHLRRRDNRSQTDAVKRSMAVIEFDLKGNILDANKLFLDTMGYQLEEIVGKHHRIFMPAEAASDSSYDAFWKRLAAGSSEKGQVKRVDKAGKIRWLEATYETLVDPEGRPFKVAKYAFDVTESRDMAMEADSLIGAIEKVQAVIEFDPQGNIIRANELFCQAMGYDEKEILGRHHRMFVDETETSTKAYNEFWEALRVGKAQTGQFRRIGKGGSEVHIRASYNPIANAAGEIVKVVKFAVDTTVFQVTADTMLHGLQRLAAGDLSVRLEKDLGELDLIRTQFNSALQQLETAIEGVMEGSRVIAHETSAITSATTELARRTEHQAATLEESSAALEQLSASVKSSAGTAAEARKIADTAKTLTEESSEIVDEAVGAMNAIADSSREISNITGVIDEIAFQTNLLALNAGVEAARAGDAGRGFAVVASEVRALAQRSSEAAKEIADLISSSTRQVDQGVNLVTRTGESLKTIAESARDIHGRVEHISSSTQEQAMSLGEMNQAVSQLDQATQKNAAMAEETNASVHSLNQSVQKMDADIGFFDQRKRTAGSHTSSTNHPGPERRSA